jgi:predicted ArsR family transcriptional regulator
VATVLDALGLSTQAQRVYEAMLESTESGVLQLSAGLSLSEAQVRAALDELAALELLRASRDRPGAWRPVSAEHGLRLLLRREAEDLEDRRVRVASMQSAVSSLVGDFMRPRPPEESDEIETLQVLTGLDAIQERMEAIAHGAKVSCRSVVPGGAVAAEALEACRPLDTELLERGIDQRVLYQDPARTDHATMAYGLWMVRRGAQVRTAAVLPPRMLIVDDVAALVPAFPGSPRRGAVVVTNRGVIECLISLFDLTWNSAAPLDDDLARDEETELLPFERELLRLLAQGMTDEAAAKRLGVSLRTVRRRMTELMGRLDADSRFAAGMRAAQRGWI